MATELGRETILLRFWLVALCWFACAQSHSLTSGRQRQRTTYRTIGAAAAPIARRCRAP